MLNIGCLLEKVDVLGRGLKYMIGPIIYSEYQINLKQNMSGTSPPPYTLASRMSLIRKVTENTVMYSYTGDAYLPE